MSYYDFIIDGEMDELRELMGMTESEVLDDFRLFCKYAEVPTDHESWNYYIVETRDQV